MNEKLKWIQDHIAVLCIAAGAFFATFVFISWAIGYYANALFGMHFQIESCWMGLSSALVGLIGFFKWAIDSSKNSLEGQLPEGYQSVVAKLTGTGNSTEAAQVAPKAAP